jgi:hypothetical protein
VRLRYNWELKMTLDPGSRIGPFEILALLGQGSMGQVYGAVDNTWVAKLR